jgi:hypothetical protein
MDLYQGIRSTTAGLQTAAEQITRAPMDESSWRFSANGVADLAVVVQQLADRLEQLESRMAHIEASSTSTPLFHWESSIPIRLGEDPRIPCPDALRGSRVLLPEDHGAEHYSRTSRIGTLCRATSW